jgi:Holliday junction DNA helicase RuvB
MALVRDTAFRLGCKELRDGATAKDLAVDRGTKPMEWRNRLGCIRTRRKTPAEDEPMADLNDASPTSLAHIVGQTTVINQLRVALDAAFEDHKRLDDALLVGPPGLGKSQIASVIGHELATKYHEVLGQSIKHIGDLNALLLAAGDQEVVFIDEVHELNKSFQTSLYLGLDKRRIVVRGGRSYQSIPLADFTLLLGTTDEYSLLQPLRDRMRMLLRFDFYSRDELAKIIVHRARALQWAIDESLPPLIAQRARGTPRLALRLLQACWRVCRAEGERSVTTEHLRKACALEHLDDRGLGPMEQRYLKILAEGASRLNVIASMLGLPARTLSTVTEPFLLRAGLVLKDDAGRRQLTAQGQEHLAKLCQEGVQLVSD